MSNPQLYQADRWELLRLLEKDLSGAWLLCFDCFILHPAHVFVKPQKPLVPWLKDFFGLCEDHSQPRSCRNQSYATAVQKTGTYTPIGVVDICPCAKITLGKKHRIEAILYSLDRDQYWGHWLHQCQYVYDDIELQIKFRYVPCDSDDELGAHINYYRTSPSGSSSVCPRMSCPHIHLDTVIDTLSQCRELHSEHVVCARCRGLQCCQHCHSTVSRFTKEINSPSGMNSYVVDVKRRLSKELWHEHIVYPFARQRQYDLKSRRSGWKPW